MEFEAVDEGVVGRLLVAEGTAGVKVNTPIAVLVEAGEDAPGDAAAKPAPAPAPAPDKAPAPAPAPAGTAAGGGPEKAAARPAAGPTGAAGGRLFASPLARRIAQDRGIDLAGLRGSGPAGRIVKADVEAAGAAAPAPAAAAAAPPAGASAAQVARMYQGRAYDEVALDGMRRTIAARLAEAKQTIPHFYLRRDVQLDALLALRGTLNAGLTARGIKLSVNDFIIKACALALQQVPEANAVWAGDRILRLKPSDVAVAVAVEGGLFTPVLQDAHSKSLSALSTEMKDLALRARNRKLAPQDYTGGSMAISNLGMFGIDSFDAVINPPHGSILAVGAGTRRPVVTADGALGVATVMTLTLSVDHRVIDGTLGAELLGAVVAALESPMTMLV
jgi:pyruvate dehydrogenase E2 component (dihydrolipoamide acetyltransferase)